jgi:hypothetical protein
MQPLIAKALRTDLNRSVELSMKAVSSYIHAKVEIHYEVHHIRSKALQYDACPCHPLIQI